MIDQRPLITAVIPTYRRPQLLRRAVLSVLRQTYPNLRVCVYDDASGDDTRAVMEELMRQDQRVFYCEHPQNVGPFDNFELGIRRVSTPYFSVLSDDNVLLPEFYAQAMEGFNRYPKAAFVATKTLVVEGDQIVSILFDENKEKYYVPPEGLIKISLGKTNTWTGSVYSRDAVADINFDRAMFGEPVEQDFLFRVVVKLPYLVKPVPGAIFIAHGSSMSASRRSDDVIQRYQRMFSKIEDYPDVSDSDKGIVIKNAKRILINALYDRALIDIKSGDFDLAMKIAITLRNNFAQTNKSALLFVFAKIFKSNKIIYFVCAKLYAIWKKVDLRKITKKQSSNDIYGSYLKYLDKYSGT
ncbi:glycosyltransferase [Patescibacteria group bacterium]|nr:glycosyltransferase [Patescibacteria group bacterium]